MLNTEQDKIKQEISVLVEKYGSARSSLIPVLQEIQGSRHVIGDFAMQVLADLLDIHPVEVHGVVTFYAFLKEKHQGRFVIRLCRTISCDMAGKDAVARQLQTDLGIRFGETTPDGRFTLEWANCIGMCDQGPAMLINDKVFIRVTPDMVHDIISGFEKTFGSFAPQTEEGHAL